MLDGVLPLQRHMLRAVFPKRFNCSYSIRPRLVMEGSMMTTLERDRKHALFHGKSWPILGSKICGRLDVEVLKKCPCLAAFARSLGPDPHAAVSWPKWASEHGLHIGVVRCDCGFLAWPRGQKRASDSCERTGAKSIQDQTRLRSAPT